jgi:excisionase family DNA binding protein
MSFQPGRVDTLAKYAPVPRAIEILGVGRTKLYELAGEGHLRTVKVGTRTLVDIEHALAWFATLPTAKIAAPRQTAPA